MKLFKTKTGQFAAVFLIVAVFFTAVSPQILSAQSKRLVGELTVTKNGSTAASDGFVTIDGVRAASGRSVMSPSEIVTPPDATAKILLGQTGAVTVAPNSTLSLTFVDSSIAGDLTTGEVTLETVPNTALNIFTKEGGVWTPNRNEKNTVKISVQNGTTRITVLEGQVMFNQVFVSAGETFPKLTSGDDQTSPDSASSSDGISPLLIVGILGAVGAAVLIALTVSSGDDNNPVVSPTR